MAGWKHNNHLARNPFKDLKRTSPHKLLSNKNEVNSFQDREIESIESTESSKSTESNKSIESIKLIESTGLIKSNQII